MAHTATAQHVRLYAVVLGNDDPASSLAASSEGTGLWQSDDTGRTWKPLGWKHIKAFSMDHDSNGRVLYLAAGNGVLKSTNYGESWKVMTDWRVAEVLDVRIVKSKPGIVLAATAHGVIKSTDYGATWKKSHTGIAQPYTSRLLLDEPVVYVCTEEGLYRSEDYGSRWKLIPQCGSAVRAAIAFKDLAMIVSETSITFLRHDGAVSSSVASPSVLWDGYYAASINKRFVAGPDGVAEFSSDNVMTFTGPKDTHSITSIGDKIFAGTLRDGIWIREGLAGKWRALALPTSQIWTMKTVLIR